jgi:hypothetical protein
VRLWELFWGAFGRFGLVWFATSGLFVILVQALLPRAWDAIRANPPHGPDWAYTLWYRRSTVYGGLMALSLLLAALATLLYFLGLF